jgi:hypothetical protein
MKQVKFFLVTTSIALCFVITNSCSQTTAPGSSSVLAVFKATTPCNEVAKTMLGIPPAFNCEMMKWDLTLYQDPKTFAPSAYKFICIYGMPKQGTKDFMEGAKTIELKGKCTISKGTAENTKAIVYKLIDDNSSISLSFLKPDENLLHLLDPQKQLMIGTGAWSYTLNRTNPVASSVKFSLKKTSNERIAGDSAIVGVFDGRTPCNNELRELNKISDDGCQIIKCRLTLYQDAKTHTPATFLLQTIYVGKGDIKHSTTGKWIVTRDSKTDPETIIYHLEPDGGDLRSPLAFLKADDNILFFLDNNGSLMVGDAYTSYTLSRKMK